MKNLLSFLIVALLAQQTALAQNKQTKEKSINLRCVGELTETFKGMEAKSYQIVRYYELSKDKVVEHMGAEIFETTRQQIEKAEDSSTKRSNGYYRYEQNQIIYNANTEWKMQAPSMVTYRYFSINRQNGRWSANEFYSGGLIPSLDCCTFR